MLERVTAIRSARVRARFECSRCGERRWVQVDARAAGVGEIPVHDAGSFERAKVEALELADQSLKTEAADALKLVRCPSCGNRSRSQVASLVAWTVIPAVIASAFAFWMFRLGSWLVVTVVGLPLLGFAIAWLAIGVRAYARAGRDVWFDEPPPDAPLRGSSTSGRDALVEILRMLALHGSTRIELTDERLRLFRGESAIAEVDAPAGSVEAIREELRTMGVRSAERVPLGMETPDGPIHFTAQATATSVTIESGTQPKS